jgi:peroxiredoxin
MFNRSHLLIVLLALLGAGAGLFAGRALRPDTRIALDAAAMIEPGSRRLDATLPDPQGRAQALSQWDGKLVLLNFWASWCAPCIEEMPLLDHVQRESAARGLQIIGIASDAVAPTRAFLAAHAVAYPILIDDPELGDLSRGYGNVHGVLPYSVLIGRDGRLLARKIGNFSERELRAWLHPHL